MGFYKGRVMRAFHVEVDLLIAAKQTCSHLCRERKLVFISVSISSLERVAEARFMIICLIVQLPLQFANYLLIYMLLVVLLLVELKY